MAYSEQAEERKGGPVVAARLRAFAVWSFVAVLAWAPFPLGSAVSWGAGLLEILIASCWLIWCLANWNERDTVSPARWSVIAALLVACMVDAWSIFQTLPIVAQTWVHPVWSMAASALGRHDIGTISIDPWRTEGAALKLASLIMACWLAYLMGQRSEQAKILFDAVVVIAVAYSIYGFALASMGMTQAQLIYALPFSRAYVTGPFMLHNSFATYVGLALLAAIAKLFGSGRETVIASRGARRYVTTLLQYVFGRGALYLTMTVVLLAALIASASRGGFAAACIGMATMGLVSLTLLRGRYVRLWSAAAAAATVVSLCALLLSGQFVLSDRVDRLLDAHDSEAIRLSLWSTTVQMIGDAPWRGLGLGTFEDAYPLYATQTFPLVMDKAHCDYLELAAGVGIPAAIGFGLAILWSAVVCLRGVYSRRRNRIFPLTALCACVLVAVHSAVDFSLQIPAVALSFAILLGSGLAQASSQRG